MWSRIKNLALVSFAAALIWVWAEAESLRTVPTLSQITFAAPADGSLDVRVLESITEAVSVRMEGSTSAVDAAERAVARVRFEPGVGGIPSAPGEHPIDLQQALQARPEIGGLGVTIAAVDPPRVTLRIEQLVTRDLPVRADLAGIESQGEVTVAPATVKVRMLASQAAKLTDSATALAVVNESDRDRLRGPGPQTVTTAVRLPDVLQGSGPLRVTPESVRLTFTPRALIEDYVIPSVPVWVTLPPTESARWDVEVTGSPFVLNVSVSGPADVIDELRSRRLVALAFVMLTSDELEAGILSKAAVFAPVPAELLSNGTDANAQTRPDAAAFEGVAPLRFSADNRRVQLKITRRTAPTPP
jgi:hypothetical protein